MNIKIIAIAAVVAVWGFSSLSTAKEMVGGNCTYEKFDGVCEKEKDEAGSFRFKGVVNSATVTLAHNKLGSSEVLKDKAACALQFIKSGTCTPCVISIGECGKDAWELFRKSAK